MTEDQYPTFSCVARDGMALVVAGQAEGGGAAAHRSHDVEPAEPRGEPVPLQPDGAR